MVKIQFENNTFNDHAQAIGAVFDFSDSTWQGIAGEVENAKRQAPPEKMTIALENLECAVRKHSKRDTAGVIRQFASVLPQPCLRTLQARRFGILCRDSFPS